MSYGMVGLTLRADEGVPSLIFRWSLCQESTMEGWFQNPTTDFKLALSLISEEQWRSESSSPCRSSSSMRKELGKGQGRSRVSDVD